MTKATKSRVPASNKPARKINPKAASVPDDLRPGGKLGLIVDKLAAKRGATADELVEATGWQRHSVLGALSKLKSRGFDFKLDIATDRKAYRLSTRKG